PGPRGTSYQTSERGRLPLFTPNRELTLPARQGFFLISTRYHRSASRRSPYRSVLICLDPYTRQESVHIVLLREAAVATGPATGSAIRASLFSLPAVFPACFSRFLPLSTQPESLSAGRGFSIPFPQ